MVAASAGLALSALLATATVVAHWANRHHDLLAVWPGQLRFGWLINASSALIFALPGWYLVSRRPRIVYGWLALLAALGHGLGGLGLEYALASQLGGRSWPVVTLALSLAAWGPLVEQTVLMVAYGTYPDGHLPRGWPRLAVIASVALAALGTLNVAFDSQPGRGATLAALASLHNPVSLPFATSSAGIIPAFFAPSALLVLAALVHRWRRATGEARRLLTWIVAVGLPVILVVPPAVVLLPAGIGTAVGQATTLLEVTVIVAATLRHHVFGIDLVLNRTLVLATLTAVVSLVYGATVGLATVLGASTGVSSFAAALLAALALGPISAHVRRGVNRLLYGARDEPYEVLARLSASAGAVASTEQLLPGLVHTIGTALKVPYARIDLDPPVRRPPTEWGTKPHVLHRLPLVHHGRELGLLTVGLRSGQRDLSDRERHLLEHVAHQAATVAENVVLNEHLLRSRERLVAAREEERRRLRMDLHDGLGPQLTAVALGLDLLAEAAQPTSPSVADQAERLHHELKEAIGEIRRLVEGLRPPRLDEAGLTGAIGELASRAQRSGVAVTFSAPATHRQLPAAVEVAAYRIAAEALNNMMRHADASACTIRLAIDVALTLIVDDNGNGLVHPLAGTGTSSMIERAEELGGRCSIEARPGTGTRVAATLPLETGT